MSTLEATVSMLEMLPESDLLAVQGVVKALASRVNDEKFFKPMTEEEMLEGLAIAREHWKEGQFKSAEESISNIKAKYGL